MPGSAKSEVRDQRQFIQAGPEGFSINPVFERGEQIPHAGNIVGKQPFLLGEDAQRSRTWPTSVTGSRSSSEVDQVFVDAGESQLLEGRNSKRSSALVRSEVGMKTSNGWRSSPFASGVTQLHQLGGGHRKGMPSWSWLPRIKDVPVGPGSPQFLADRLHDIAIGSVTRMQWPGPRSPRIASIRGYSRPATAAFNLSWESLVNALLMRASRSYLFRHFSQWHSGAIPFGSHRHQTGPRRTRFHAGGA